MKQTSSVQRCRLCACEEDLNNFFNIFDENSELELEMKITKLLPVVVMPWDPMPHTVCSKCIDKLNSFNDFYDASLKADRFLRTLHPSAPEGEIENVNPVVEVLDHPILKLPPKKRQGLSTCSHKTKKIVESSDFVKIAPSLDQSENELYANGQLNCFIINQITSRDSILTCRECCRTFTKKSSALSHSCVRIEDCDEVETIDLVDDSEKSLPPLKIRLFSVKSGLFVCYLCQKAFEEKNNLVEHIREHFLDGNWGEKTAGRKKPRGKRKGRARMECGEDDDWEETYRKKAAKRKRKRCSGLQKRGKPKVGGEGAEIQNGPCMRCGQDPNSSTIKETMESTTQYSEVSNDSEMEIQIKDEETPINSTAPENLVLTKVENENDNKSTVEDKSDSMCPDEIPKSLENDSKSDEVTVLEVVSNRSSMSFSSCVFCDKIFATKNALVVHQNKHLQDYSGLRPELEEKKAFEIEEKKAFSPPEEETFLCSICAMMFTNKKILLEHEHHHMADVDSPGCQRKIRIALGPEFPDRDCDQEHQASKGRGFITITVTAGEKKIPQIELL